MRRAWLKGTPPLRVLHVVASNQRRGAEVFAHDLMGVLAQRGVEQSVAVLRGVGKAELGFPVDTHVLGQACGSFRARFDLPLVRRLRKLIREWRPDVIQAHGGEPLKYAFAAAGRLETSLVYRRIGATPAWMAGSTRKGAHAFMIRRADLVIAVADAVRTDAVENFGVDSAKVVVIPNGVDLRRAQAIRGSIEVRHALGIEATHRVVTWAGAFTDEKDPLGLVRVAASVVEEDDLARFLVVGDGPLRSEVEALVERLGLGDRILLLGTRSDVADVLAASDVLLLTSRTEGMPAIVIEAGLAGLPVIAYGVGAVPEVVVDGVSGLLAPPGDAPELTRRLLRVLGDPPLRRELAGAGRDRCRARYDITPIAATYLDTYRRLVHRASPQLETNP